MNPDTLPFTTTLQPGRPALLWPRPTAGAAPFEAMGRCWWPGAEVRCTPPRSAPDDDLPLGARRARDLTPWPCGGGHAWSADGFAYRKGNGQPVEAVGAHRGGTLGVALAAP